MQVLLLLNVGTNERMVFKEPVQFQIDGKDFPLGGAFECSGAVPAGRYVERTQSVGRV